MTRNFHRWEVDPFFSAAEEVQDSTDRLESVYRTWMHAKFDADDITLIEYQRRELSTVLGTAKWQLEEFERAISCVIVDGHDHAGDDAPSRHKQFIDALQSQISTIETALSSSENCKDLKPHQVLRLGEKEKDDLELFLCGGKSSKEGHFHSSTAFQVGRTDEVAHCSGQPLEPSNGVLSHFLTSAVDSGVDSGIPKSAVCPWTHDTCCSEALSPNLHEAGRVNEIKKPVSDPTPEYFHSDRGEHFGESANGHQRSVSVGSSLNAWKSGSITDLRSKRRRLVPVQMPSNRLSFWAMFTRTRYPRKYKSGLKRWKDGDASARDSEMLTLMEGICDNEQGNQTSWFGAKTNCLGNSASDDLEIRDNKHYRTLCEGLQIRQRTQYTFPSSRLVQIASAILVAVGLVGLLSFHVTSSSL